MAGEPTELVRTSEKSFASRLLPGELACPADGLGLFARLLFGGLLEMLPKLHFTEDALTLELLLESTKGLIDIVVADKYLHRSFPNWFATALP